VSGTLSHLLLSLRQLGEPMVYINAAEEVTQDAHMTVTVDDIMEHYGMKNSTYDTALPQAWVNEAQKLLDAMEDSEMDWIFGRFVWLYPEQGDGHVSPWGRPFPLFIEAKRFLDKHPELVHAVMA